MARAKITNPTDDLIDDSGSVLWSFIRGEQLEYPVTLNFLDTVLTAGFQFEAVAVEALNTSNQAAKPSSVKPGGVQTVLTVRLPNYVGNWSAASSYNYEDVVLRTGVYYKLKEGSGRVSATEPVDDPLWEVTSLRIVHIQFPSTLGSTYEVAPTAGSPIYAFFELRVTEPNNSVFRRTWKPVRGMIELLFSPTDIVADV